MLHKESFYLVISREREIFPQRVSLEAVVGEDPPEVGMVGEKDAVHVPDLTLIPGTKSKNVHVLQSLCFTFLQTNDPSGYCKPSSFLQPPSYTLRPPFYNDRHRAYRIELIKRPTNWFLKLTSWRRQTRLRVTRLVWARLCRSWPGSSSCISARGGCKQARNGISVSACPHWWCLKNVTNDKFSDMFSCWFW